MLTSYYTLVREEIESFGGTVEKFIGGAVTGVFGAPVAHGDDPERAVRAALGIRHRIGRVNVSDSDRGLEVRIGVNTGEALVALDARPGEGEAVALYRQALALVGEDDPKRRRELRLKLAVAQQMLYHVSDAQAGARYRREPSGGP